MSNLLIARASIIINAEVSRVWDALVNPEIIKKYMFGTTVISNWHEGSPILWKGEWQGKPYEDKGEIISFKKGKLIKYTHFSPMTGLPDSPENYHTVTVELTVENSGVLVSLSQDNNPDETFREHSEQNWKMMLKSLKDCVEQSGSV